MPRMFRVMMKDANGHPSIADNGGLGVRLNIDVRLDAQGNVRIENKGMSVFRAWRDVPLIRRPERLGGRGEDDTFFFRHGDGPWASGIMIEDKLDLVTPSGRDPNHGVVRPLQLVALATFRTHLEETRPDWVLDES